MRGARAVRPPVGRRKRRAGFLRGLAVVVGAMAVFGSAAWAAGRALDAGVAVRVGGAGSGWGAGAPGASPLLGGDLNGSWRLVVEPASGEGEESPAATAWAAGRDAGGRWRVLPGWREGGRWVFDIPAQPPLAEVRFGAREGTAGRVPALDELLTDPGLPVRWQVTWQAEGSGSEAGYGETVTGRGTPGMPRAPVFLPVVPAGVETAPEPEVERPRWGTERARGTGREKPSPGSARHRSLLGHGSVELLPHGVPVFEVTLPTFRTTDWEPVVRGHALWRWDFGDGTRTVDPNPDHAIHRVFHRFPREGTYTVTAVSYDATGRALIRYRWRVVIPKPDLVAQAARAVTGTTPGPLDDAALIAARELALTRAFSVAAPQAPRVDLRLEGPATWVVGRPATFRLQVQVQNPPFTERIHVEYDPGPVFSVRWRRPGTFRVDGAVRVRVYYRIHGTSIALSHVYRVSRTVEVHALRLSD